MPRGPGRRRDRSQANVAPTGYGHQEIGFNYVWRLGGPGDGRPLAPAGRPGRAATAAHTDWVGLDIYPGTYAPGLLLLVPLAKRATRSSRGSPRRESASCRSRASAAGSPAIEEMGSTAAPPGPQRGRQRRLLRELLGAAHAFRGAYGLTDVRWSELRDNNSSAAGWQSHSGLLRDDYSPNRPSPSTAARSPAGARDGAERRPPDGACLRRVHREEPIDSRAVSEGADRAGLGQGPPETDPRIAGRSTRWRG